MEMIVRIVHLGFIAWMIWAPFSGTPEILLMHAVMCPFLMLHWLTNSDGGCFLTLLEKKLRGIDDDESFIHSIVAPLYVIDDAVLKKVVFGTTLVLWGITLGNLARMRSARSSSDESFF